ncbi:MAG: SH3 domain-containing protein, partial [Clostridiales bacterium]|nr:SH3 domain-containing protein [Clostridiales bacterium]
PADASQVDGVSMAANIEAYQDGQLVSSYPLYISTQPMPSEQPEQPQNAWVTVEYLLNGGAIYSTTVELAPGDQMVYPDASLVPDYDLVSTDGVPVHVENDGTATPSYVSFTVAEKQAPAQNAWVTVQYVCDNEVLNTTTVELTPGDHSLSPDEGMVPGGYALASYDAVTVSVGADGSAYPNPVTFTLTRPQEPEQPDQPTETDPGNTEEPGNTGDSGNNDGITVVRELNAYGVTTVGGLKLRDMPEGKAVFSSIKKGVNIYAYREVQFVGSSYNWYAIRYKETDCYVRADCFEMLSKEESDKLLYGDKAVELTVQGLDYDTNEVLYTDTVECPWVQSTPVTAREVQDYTVQGEATQTVTVDENGVASPEMVTFFYVKNPVEPVKATLTVYYVSDQGAELYPAESHEVTEGSYPAVSFAKEAPQGYEAPLANAETVTVGSDGSIVPSVLTFTYAALPAEPAKATLTVLYVDDQGGTVYDTQTVELTEGSYAASQYQQSAPEGYEVPTVNAETVTVSADGTISPDTLVFTYVKRVVEPAKGTLTVHYVDEQGTELYPAESHEVTEGSYRAANFAKETPQGYEAPRTNADTVTVTGDGSVIPAELVFTFAKEKVVEAQVTIQYQDEDKREIAPSETITLPVGENQPTGEYAKQIDGYTYKSVSSETVTVTQDGKANPSIITFTYSKNATTANLRIHYVNAIGTDLIEPEDRPLSPGTYTITADSGKVPSGYVLSPATQPVQVTVKENLEIEPNSISFTCYDATVTGSLTIQYYDVTTGTLIATETRSLPVGTHSVAPDDSVVASHGTYTRSDATGNATVQVTVGSGNQVSVNPSVVTFYYQPSDVKDYLGYLLVTRQTAQRRSASAAGEVIQTLPVNTVLWSSGQRVSGAVTWHSAQTTDGNNTMGWVNDADVRRITKTEADAILEEQRQQQNQPVQNTGYYITLYDSVPLRQYANAYASAKYLDKNQVVYVYGQVYDESGYVWHKTTYGGTSGYVKDGQLRKLTDAEVDRYRQTGSPLPTTPSSTVLPTYNPFVNSSYGYVTSNGVNFRTTPSLKGARIKQLNRYAMAMIYDTQVVDGVTWYKVNYNGTTGWIHGDYFHQMSLTELNSFLTSREYELGIQNNSTANNSGSTSNNTNYTKPSTGNTGSSTQGKVESVEDWNVGTWKNTGVTSETSYQPFNPYATPSATATAEAETTVSPTPTSTMVIGTMIPITYEDETKETQTSSVPWGLIGGAIVLLGGAGGVYAYALNQNKRRKEAAARAAANRRAAASGNGSANTSPYARRAVAAPNASGAQQKQGTAGSSANPYSRQAGSPYAAGQSANPYTGGAAANGSAAYNPYSRQPGNPYAPSQSANPYATPTGSTGTIGSTGTTGNAGANGSTGVGESATSTVNPYAPQSSAASTPQTGSNPYARPLDQPPAEPKAESQTAARRSRMQRYHDAGSDHTQQG